MPRMKSKGRQKVQMTRMSKESNLLVTFSKRRSGLFKKASELCTLCGVEIAIIVFSPGKKVFSFGHPCVEAILDRFLMLDTSQSTMASSSSNPMTLQLMEAHRNASVRELNMQLTEVLNQADAEKKRSDDLKKMRKESQRKCWWESPIEDLALEELEQLKMAMEELKSNIGKQAEKLMVEATHHNYHHQNNIVPIFATPPPPPPPPRSLHRGAYNKSDDDGFGDVKGGSSGLLQGLSMTPHGYTLGLGHGFF